MEKVGKLWYHDGTVTMLRNKPRDMYEETFHSKDVIVLNVVKAAPFVAGGIAQSRLYNFPQTFGKARSSHTRYSTHDGFMIGQAL